jgi:intracellular sulfur oxidation DsrE/DsrF family protein
MAAIKLMIHAPTPQALMRAQANARNLLKLEPDARIEIVVNGPAAADALAIEDVSIRGLLVLCNNSLINQGLEVPEDLRIVPAAVQHLARQQGEGWSYMRA